MFDGRDLDAAEQLVDDWQAGIEARATQARELSARLAALSATARSDDELVTVTVGPSGDLVALELDERIRDRPSAETAREIMAALRAARATLTAAVTEATTDTMGADSATGQAIIASYTGRLGEPDA
jgi:DNA-binding protein YbaB